MQHGTRRAWFSGVAALAVVALAEWWLATGEDEPAHSAVVDAATLAAEQVAAKTDPMGAALEREAAPPPSGDAPSSEAVVEAKPRATFRGRCVAAEDGSPITGCKVVAEGAANDVVSGADGVFAVDVVRDENSVLVFTAAERAGRRLYQGGASPVYGVVDFGDVPLVRGFSITGRVVDASGAGVPDLGVYVIAVSVGDERRDHGCAARNGGAARAHPLR